MPRRRTQTIQRAPRAASVIVADLNFGKYAPKPRNIDRTCAALYAISSANPDVPVDVEDVIDTVYEEAQANGETLGPRTKQGIYTAFSSLCRNGYIRYLPTRDGVERIVLKEPLKKILAELTTLLQVYSATVEESSDIEVNNAICDFFRRKLKPGFKPAYTRRELDLQVRELEFIKEDFLQHMKDCHVGRRSLSLAPTELFGEIPEATVGRRSLSLVPTEIIDEQREFAVGGRSLSLTPTEIIEESPESTVGGRSLSLAPTEIIDERPELTARDSMYFDDVPQIRVQEPTTVFTPSTPIRRSATLNNPEAYPSPESLRRDVPQHHHPRTPPQSPSHRSRSITPPAFFQHGGFEDDDDDMDVDTTVAGSSPDPKVDLHEECRAEISRLEKQVSIIHVL
ncbi:hypothetical protein CVT26_013923 [Gymnopilus dilepis]|uniref:Uncharacterized protein n=1 Tax=Gymnopilus dilepis TaxID=231916 RepID=A0A409WT13_9AGAR|nr:hypothetical protein CVT26_013923 [Gymnopilus dilepis]